MYGKKRPVAIVWYQLYVSGCFMFKFRRVVVTLGRRVTKKKRLGKTRVNHGILHTSFATIDPKCIKLHPCEPM